MHLCFLCKGSASEGYNIGTTYVFDNSKLLISLLEEATNNKLTQHTANKICGDCCQLLNELHEYHKKVTQISHKLHSYLAHSLDVVTTDVTDVKNKNCLNNLNLQQTTEAAVLEKHTDKRYLKCHVCFKLFVSKSGLTKHLKKQHSERSCENVESLDKVETKSLNESINDGTINIGTNVFKEKYNYGKQKPYQCTQCPKKWKTAGELKNHLLSHSNIKPFICEICGQAYKHKSALDVHVGMHNGVCPFICVYCKKSFTQKGALRRHLPIHTGETPYQCDLCGKRFIHHTSFKIHSLSHSGQKSYKCETCGLALLSASHLKRHMRVHTGEKKYACSTCGKRFAERYNLASHQKLHNSPSSKKEKQKSRVSETFCNKKHIFQERAEIVIPQSCSNDVNLSQEYLCKSIDKYS